MSAAVRYMAAEQFNRWLGIMELSDREAARMLGVHVATVRRWRYQGGPLVLSLACSAIYRGLEAWK